MINIDILIFKKGTLDNFWLCPFNELHLTCVYTAKKLEANFIQYALKDDPETSWLKVKITEILWKGKLVLKTGLASFVSRIQWHLHIFKSVLGVQKCPNTCFRAAHICLWSISPLLTLTDPLNLSLSFLRNPMRSCIATRCSMNKFVANNVSVISSCTWTSL